MNTIVLNGAVLDGTAWFVPLLAPSPSGGTSRRLGPDPSRSTGQLSGPSPSGGTSRRLGPDPYRSTGAQA